MRAAWPALLIALATVAHAQVPSPKNAEAEVLAALAEGDRVFAAGDENAVARFMADDYLQTNAVGHVEDKATWLKEYFEFARLRMMLVAGTRLGPNETQAPNTPGAFKMS